MLRWFTRCFYEKNLCKRLLFRRNFQSGNTKTLEKRHEISEMRFLHIRYKYKECLIKNSRRVLDFGLNFHQHTYDLGKYTQTKI